MTGADLLVVGESSRPRDSRVSRPISFFRRILLQVRTSRTMAAISRHTPATPIPTTTPSVTPTKEQGRLSESRPRCFTWETGVLERKSSRSCGTLEPYSRSGTPVPFSKAGQDQSMGPQLQDPKTSARTGQGQQSLFCRPLHLFPEGEL